MPNINVGPPERHGPDSGLLELLRAPNRATFFLGVPHAPEKNRKKRRAKKMQRTNGRPVPSWMALVQRANTPRTGAVEKHRTRRHRFLNSQVVMRAKKHYVANCSENAENRMPNLGNKDVRPSRVRDHGDNKDLEINIR